MMNKDSDEFYEILDNMETYGGSFVRALSKCLRLADSTNTEILINAFPKYMEMYDPKSWKS